MPKPPELEDTDERARDYDTLLGIVALVEGRPYLSTLVNKELLSWVAERNRHGLDWNAAATIREQSQQDMFRYLRHKQDQYELAEGQRRLKAIAELSSAVMLQAAEAAKHLEAASNGLLRLAEELSKSSADRTDPPGQTGA